MVGPARREPRFVYLSDRFPEESTDPAARYGWRLVAANNRPLGRGATVEASWDDCLARAAALHAALSAAPELSTATDRIGSAIVPDALHGVWSWRVVLDGELAAVGVHPYLRRVECARGLAQFVASAGAADPADGVVRHFGPHSLRGYEGDATRTDSSLGATR